MDTFVSRHNGPRENEVKEMLQKIGVSSVDELIEQTVPSGIRLKKPLKVAAAMTEFQYHKHLKALGKKNKVFRSYIGLGYNHNIMPAVIQRNVLENAGWYTAYTLSSRNCARTFRSFVKFPDYDYGFYSHANRQCIFIR